MDPKFSVDLREEKTTCAWTELRFAAFLIHTVSGGVLIIKSVFNQYSAAPPVTLFILGPNNLLLCTLFSVKLRILFPLILNPNFKIDLKKSRKRNRSVHSNVL